MPHSSWDRHLWLGWTSGTWHALSCRELTLPLKIVSGQIWDDNGLTRVAWFPPYRKINKKHHRIRGQLPVNKAFVAVHIFCMEVGKFICWLLPEIIEFGFFIKVMDLMVELSNLIDKCTKKSSYFTFLFVTKWQNQPHQFMVIGANTW